MTEKLKSLLIDDGFYTVVLFLLIGVTSFGLGRASVTVLPPPAGVSIIDAPTPALSGTTAPDRTELRVVASRSGSRYHLPSCPGAQQIAKENKLVFDSVTAAVAAGYTPAANCPGL